MRRPKQHVMEDKAIQAMTAALPAEWIVRNVVKDYGVDFEIELVDSNIVTGNRIWVQLKSVCKARVCSMSYTVGDEFPDLQSNSKGKLEVDYVSYSLSRKELEYALTCPFPLLLFLCDLSSNEIYWLPIRDEIIVNISQNNHKWRCQRSSVCRIPIHNTMNEQAQRNFSGLRWHAMEPARMYAFATLHYYHHEFQYTGRLSGYSVGEGWIDHGEEEELRQSLILAADYLESALGLDVLFGSNGIDYFRLDRIPGININGIRGQLQKGRDCVELAMNVLDQRKYDHMSICMLVGEVAHAIDLMSTAIASYQGFRGRYLLTEGAAVWAAAASSHGLGREPIIPMSRRPRK